MAVVGLPYFVGCLRNDAATCYDYTAPVFEEYNTNMEH
jgi:hypothetical protein